LPIAALLLISGAATALVGLIALLGPGRVFQLAFAIKAADDAILFLVRHWGVLLFVVGALIGWSAQAPVARAPILAAASFEKFAAVLMLFLVPVKPTRLLVATLAADGLLAIFYVAIIAGLGGA